MHIFRRDLLLSFIAVVITGCTATQLSALAETIDTPEPPVILLTGFEPFGAQRQPNPSWEGIKELNGTEIGGYKIICHQLPVVWGEPGKHLKKQIEKHHPVAVLSFGQGYPNAFAIESVALNARMEIPDNNGKPPVQPTVTEGGPDSYKSTFPCRKMSEALVQQGYPVRVSSQAGQYLCEETLYSLEHVRSSHDGPLTVSFCHVPPLGSRVGKNGETVVDEKYVQQFVTDYIKAWQALEVRSEPQSKPAETAPANAAPAKKDTSEGSCDPEEPVAFEPTLASPVVTLAQVAPAQKAQTAPASPAKHPEQDAVEELIERYFKSWSEQRMKDYGDCFAKDAVIQELNARNEIFTQMKGPFVATQATYHKMALFKATEIPVRTTITFEADLARAVVYWKLTAGPRKQVGYDHFTLIKQNGEWKIANLLFYGTKDPE